MSVDDLSKRCGGLHTSIITCIEDGIQHTDAWVLGRLAEALTVDLEYLENDPETEN
jgi:hypothetical protein